MYRVTSKWILDVACIDICLWLLLCVTPCYCKLELGQAWRMGTELLLPNILPGGRLDWFHARLLDFDSQDEAISNYSKGKKSLEE